MTSTAVSRKGHLSDRELRERDVKAFLKRSVENAGGRVFPWRSQGVNGVMDRVAIWPGGIIDTIELKRPEGGKLSKLQEGLIEWMTRQGHKVWIITNRGEVMQYVAYRTALARSALLAKAVSGGRKVVLRGPPSS